MLCSLELLIVWVHPLNVAFGLEFFLHLRNYVIACKRVNQVKNDHRHPKLKVNINCKLLHFDLFLVLAVIHLISLVAEMGQTVSASHGVTTWLGSALLHG